MTKKKQVNYRMLRIVVAPFIALFFVSFGLLGIAGKYPVTQETFFMHAPNPLSLASLLASGALAILYHLWLKRQIKQPHTINERGTIYTLDFVVILSLLYAIPSLGLIVNGALDSSIPKTVAVEIVDKKIVYGRYGSRFVYLRDLSNSEHIFRIRVDGSEYQTSDIGDFAQVVTKDGFLGYEWLMDYSLKNKTSPYPGSSSEQPFATPASPTQPKTLPPTAEFPTPDKTKTPESQGPPLFIIPTPETIIVFPPATPAAQAGDYRLKPWSESEALSLIAEINKIIPSVETEEQRSDVRQYLILAEREFLLRFPTSTLSPSLRWELAFREGTTYFSDSGSYHYPVNTMRTLLEEALNSKQVQPDSLGSWLSTTGFKLEKKLDAPNLYGDGRAANIIHIEALDSGRSISSAVFVVQEQEDESYQVTAVRERWLKYNATSGGGDEIISLNDLNGNGRSEIISIESAWGHALCTTELSIYEWQGDRSDGHIVDLAQLIPVQYGDYLNSNCRGVWGFERSKMGDAKVIYATPGLSGPTTGGCPYEQPSWTRYGWTGSYFEWEAEAEDTHLQVEECADWEDVKEAMEGMSFATELEAMEALREAGLQVWTTKASDLTGDGSRDLLLLIDSDNDSSYYELWALIRDRGNIIPIQLPASYYEPDSYFSTLQACSTDPNESQMNVFSLDDQDVIFQLDELPGGYHVEDLLFREDPMIDLPSQVDGVPALTGPCELPESYRWDPLTGRYYLGHESSQADMILELEDIEQVFFNLDDLNKAIERFETFQVELISGRPLNFATSELEAKVQYLLALALELSGKEREAVEHYYQSWQLDPEGVVGWIAGRKLIHNEP